MIITECVKCDMPVFYPYEAGQEPCGNQVYGLYICKECGANNWIERISMGGQTIDDEAMDELKKTGKFTQMDIKNQ